MLSDRRPAWRNVQMYLGMAAAVLFALTSGCGQMDPAPGELAGEQALPPPALSTLTQQPLTADPEAGIQDPTAGRSPSAPIGIHIKEAGNPAALTLLSQTGGLWTHYDGFRWDLIEPQSTDPGTYLWETVADEEIIQLNRAGFKVIGIVRLAPDWAQKYPGVYCGPIAEQALDRFAQFLNQLVSRYSQPPFDVHHWEIGNEPDVSRDFVRPRSVFGCWGELSDPDYGGGYYAEMLKRAYPQIKSADPAAVVLIGGLLMDCDPVNPPETFPGSGERKDCTPSRFLDGILSSGGGDYFDGVAFHTYDYYQNETGKYGNSNWHSNWDTTGPVLRAKSRHLRDILSTYGLSDKLLFDTELALLCGRTGNEPECATESFQLTKASYLARANAAAVAESLTVSMWYNLEGWRGSGLVSDDMQPTVALNAFLASATWLKDVAFLQEVTSLPGIQGFEFIRADTRRFWVIWSQDGGARTVQLPSIPVKLADVFGLDLPASQTITVDYSPVYVEWAP